MCIRDSILVTFARTGDKGDPGAGGGVGAQGAQGVQGAQGSQGNTGGGGGAGAQGAQGHQGRQGSTGAVTYAVPAGGIILWSGAANAIPSGWALCNGSGSTPNLTGKFVVGYDPSDSDYDVGDTGGAKTFTLGVNHLPSHTHNLNHNHTYGTSTSSDGAHTHSTRLDNNRVYGHTTSGSATDGETTPYGNPGSIPGWNITTLTSSAGAHAHNFNGTTAAFNGASQPTGGGGSVDKRPPYYALCYIMKT